MRIYTKSGDKGETGLLGGVRVPKSNLRIAAIGSLDELNAALGAVSASCECKSQNEKVKMKMKNEKLEGRKKMFIQVQNDIFTAGAELADPDGKYTDKRIGVSHIEFLEKHIDELEAKLPRLKNFILPGGTQFSASAHLARAICRRAERCLVRLHEKEGLGNPQMIIYINRLSDLLFMLARENLYNKKIPEIPWKK